MNIALPQINQGQSLNLEGADSEEKLTQPTTRYSEAKLVQIMEKQGIGRPSTYSSTIKTLKRRDYVKVSKGKLVATELGLAVDEFQQETFPKLIESEFTNEMENSLDAIASGNLEWQRYFIDWNQNYFVPLTFHGISETPSRTGFPPKAYFQ